MADTSSRESRVAILKAVADLMQALSLTEKEHLGAAGGEYGDGGGNEATSTAAGMQFIWPNVGVGEARSEGTSHVCVWIKDVGQDSQLLALNFPAELLVSTTEKGMSKLEATNKGALIVAHVKGTGLDIKERIKERVRKKWNAPLYKSEMILKEKTNIEKIGTIATQVKINNSSFTCENRYQLTRLVQIIHDVLKETEVTETSASQTV